MKSMGFSTGCMHNLGISYNDSLNNYSSFPVEAIELSFAVPNDLFKFNPNKYFLNLIKLYGYASIHAPWKGIRYGKNEETGNVVKGLTKLCEDFYVDGIVIHPDVVDDFFVLEKSNLPFLIENMDIRKKLGIKPEEFERFKRDYSFGFVLDIEHAYEHDPSMNMAKELIEVMGDRLRHLHVSGQDFKTKYHSLIYDADNKEEITKILRIKKDVPWILEGILSQDFEEEIKRELEFLGNI
jgi:hypothetical protein